MTDLYLFHTLDGGDFNITDGALELSGDLRTAAYLSLFGGNEQDDGSDGNRQTFWGNTVETDPDARMISRYQHALGTMRPLTGNLRRLEDAAMQDLQWLLANKVATTVEAVATIPALNRAHLTVTINGDQTVEFIENWGEFE